MNVIHTNHAAQGEGSLALVKPATEILEEVVGPSSERVKVEWNRTEDARGRPLYSLRLSDGTDSVSATFAASELRCSTHLHYRMVRLWGDLLQLRSHKLLEDLTGPSSLDGD
jgi:hypothetical protein